MTLFPGSNIARRRANHDKVVSVAGRGCPVGGWLTASTAWSAELYSTPVGPPVSAPRPPATEYRAPLREALRVDLDVLVDGRPVRVISHEGRLYLPVPQ